MLAKKTTKKITKKTPVKKIIKKASIKKETIEDKAKLFAKNVEKEAKVITEEGKVIGNKIWTTVWSRRERSSTEDKIFMVLGVIALIRGLVILLKNGRRLFISILLIVFGILLVTGFFSKKK